MNNIGVHPLWGISVESKRVEKNKRHCSLFVVFAGNERMDGEKPSFFFCFCFMATRD